MAEPDLLFQIVIVSLNSPASLAKFTRSRFAMCNDNLHVRLATILLTGALESEAIALLALAEGAADRLLGFLAIERFR